MIDKLNDKIKIPRELTTEDGRKIHVQAWEISVDLEGVVKVKLAGIITTNSPAATHRPAPITPAAHSTALTPSDSSNDCRILPMRFF